MKYVEVVKVVREEQMKKEASVKELAGLLKKRAAKEASKKAEEAKK